MAKILGIDQQELENALIRAQNQLADSGLMAPSGERLADRPLSDRSPPERLPRGIGPSVGRPFPEALLARMDQIPNIDQQRLEDAFDQSQSKILE